MRIRIQLATPNPAPSVQEAGEVVLFRGLAPRRRSRWRAWLTSLAIHAVFVGLLSLVGSAGDPDSGEVSRYRVVPIRLQIPDPLYYAAPAPQRRPIQTRRAARPPGSASAPQAQQAGKPIPPPDAAPGGVPAPRRLQLPPARTISASAPTILEPDIQVRPKVLPADLPAMAFWARQLPKLMPKSLVLPGRRATAAAPALDAPPTLAIPNQEAAAADVNFAAALPRPKPVLPAPPASTVPLRIPDRRPDSLSPTGSIEAMEGPPANLIALSANPVPPNHVVSVLPGIQNVPKPGGDGSGGAGAGGTTPGGKAASASLPPGSRTSGPGTGRAPAAAGNGSGTQRGAGNGSGGGTQRDAGNGSGGGTGNGPHNGSGPANGRSANGGAMVAVALPAPAATNGTETGVTRVQHPSNGIFDIVVVQPSDAGGRPETNGLLNGKPIYTVYLHVGSDRDWSMQYCLPPTPAAPPSGYAIQLDNPAPVAPPFPVTTVVPNAFLAAHRPTYTLIHGYLNVHGHLTKLAVVGDPSQPQGSQIIPYLQQWEFRPATRDKQPVDVEILVTVPPRS